MLLLFERFAGLGDALKSPSQTLNTLSTLPPVIYLRRLGTRNGRNVRLGFGQNLSVQFQASLPLPLATTTSTADDDELVDYTAFMLMLNLHPRQEEAEKFAKDFGTFPNKDKDNNNESTNGGSVGEDTHVLKKIMLQLSQREQELAMKQQAQQQEYYYFTPQYQSKLLANRLIQTFEQRSGCVIIDRTFNPKIGFVKFQLESFEATELSQNKTFRYSPSYLLSSVDTITEQVLDDFFVELSRSDYMLDDALKQRLFPQLFQFVRSGIQDQREGFAAKLPSNVSLFLHGTPGIGKSTFVQVFAHSLQQALRHELAPNVQVSIVKIPLNAYLNAWNLNQILQVQGLSDWSVERMMEQALTKGHIVVLHLEECPKDFELQDSLFVCLEKMLQRKLWFRYPEYKSNVLFVFTSNYAPSARILEFCNREYVLLQAPTQDMQRTWLCRKLQNALGGLPVTVQEDAFPVTCQDIRPLNAWWISLSHALRRIVLNTFDKQDCVIKRESSNTLVLVVGQEKKQVETSDGYFYFDPSLLLLNVQQEILDAKTLTILEMTLSGELTPGVIVLGPKQQQAEQAIAQRMQQMALEEGSSFVSIGIELFNQDDENKILGESGEIRGGLMKFIDDATNPNSSLKSTYNKKQKTTTSQSQDVCLVLAKVNEIGSTLLRELLECGDKSRTHRLGVSKKGLMFIVTLAEGAQMTPQLESRAHQILC